MDGQRILIVDDDDFMAILLEGLIGDTYRIEHCCDGECGVAKALEMQPNLILMDVEMPVMDGYAACRKIRQTPALSGIPVIFLSAHVETADRLAGYEAGGDDYLTKPFVPDELRSKIEVILRNQEKNRELAYLAVPRGGEPQSRQGECAALVDALQELLGCMDFGAVANCLFNVAEALDVELSLQLRDASGHLSRNRDGICSPLEESVLSNLATTGDPVVKLGSRLAINAGRATLIAKNMPRDDATRCQWIQSALQTLANAVDVHLQSLEMVGEALQRGDKLLRILRNNTEMLRHIETSYREQRLSSGKILSELVEEIEGSFIHLGLTDNQESFLSTTLRNAVERAQALYDEDVRVEAMMREMSSGIDDGLLQEIQGAVNSAGETQGIELF